MVLDVAADVKLDLTLVSEMGSQKHVGARYRAACLATLS